MLKEKLKQEMKNRGLSPRDVAKEIGTSHTTILRTLRGDDIDLKTILKYSEWMGVKPHTLVNSMSTTKDNLADQIVVMMEGNPFLTAEFEKAIDAIQTGKVNPSVIQDIASYAAFQINIKTYPKKS